MTILSPILYLKDTLPEDSWPWVIPALRQDALVWSSLRDLQALKLAIQVIGDQPEGWKPFNLALISLDPKLNPGEPGMTQLEALPPDLLDKAVQAFEDQLGMKPPELDLPRAGLLAIYLGGHLDEASLVGLDTVLACLPPLLSEPLEILPQFTPHQAVHAVLSNPLPPGEQAEFFTKLLQNFEPGSRWVFLRELACQRPQLAAAVTREVIKDGLSSWKPGSRPHPQQRPLETLASLLSNAELQSLADEPEASLEQTTQAWETAGGMQTELAVRIIQHRVAAGNISAAHQLWKTIKTSATPDQIAEIILALCAHGYHTIALNWFLDNLPVEFESSQVAQHCLARALIAHDQGKATEASKAAQQALDSYAQSDSSNPVHLHLLTRLFLALDQPKKAIQAISLSLEDQPNNIESINLYLNCLEAAKQLNEAVQVAHLAVALQPDQLERRRALALALENAGHWSHAMHERGKIISLQETPALDDSHRFAACALKADHPQSTAAICQVLLKNDPLDADAHYYLGEAYVAMGNSRKAQSHFIQATQLVPGLSHTWLALAKVFRATHQKARWLETLQAASHAIPDDPKIHLALGEVYLEDNAPTQGLNVFRTADRLVKSARVPVDQETRSNVALSLGKALQLLSHNDEARTTLEAAYTEDPSHMGIAHAYARALLATNLPERAIPILDETRKKVPEDLDIHLDYAKACLAASQNLDETKDTLYHILETDPDYAEAKAYLAEACEANHELDQSLEAYREALSSPLQDDPCWYARLSLGLGRVSLEIGQPETAIAALNGALLANGEDLEVLKTLSSAYHAANLREKSLWAANSVLDLSPNDNGNLDWFIEQTIALDATDKAIEVLQNRLEGDPLQAPLLAKLGWLQLYQGNIQTAHHTFTKIKSMDSVVPPDLYQASQGLLAVEDPAQAIECLDKAIYMSESRGDDDNLPKFYASKILAHQMNSELDRALETLDKAIEVSPGDFELIRKKAEIHLALGQPEKAIACIEAGIRKFPQAGALQLQAVIIFRATGDLEAATAHAGSALEIFTREDPEGLDLAAAYLLADLADATLQPGLARDILAKAIPSQGESSLEALHYHCLRAELAIESGGEVEAAKALTAALQIAPDHPRVLATQARLTSQQGDLATANELLQKGLAAVGETTNHPKSGTGPTGPLVDHPANTFLALAKACLGFQQWTVSNYLLQETIKLTPNEPRSHFNLARALVLRAEYQRLCQNLDIITHAPGDSTIAEYAYQLFEDAILKAAHFVTRFPHAVGSSSPELVETKSMVADWLARGQAIFQPSSEHAEALAGLPETCEHLAAQIAALRHCDDLEAAHEKAQSIYAGGDLQTSDPTLLGQIALALAPKDPELALQAIQTAKEVSSWRVLPDRPVYQAIWAMVARFLQNPGMRLEAIEAALETWPDEPNWLSSAADLLIDLGDTTSSSKAIQYLEEAAQLEPQNTAHHLRLAETHQKLGNLKGAIVVLDQATHIIPKHPEPWLALARAYQADGDIPEAIRSAKCVIQLDPAQAEAYLLLAEVALDVENPEKAHSYIDQILKYHPDHPQALLSRATICTVLNQPDAALESLEQAIPRLPKSIPLQLQRVQLIQETKGLKVAMQALKELSTDNPEEPQIMAALSEGLSNTGDLEGAIQVAQQALKHAQDDLEPDQHVKLLLLLGRLLRKSGQLDQAIHYLSEAVDRAPETAGPYFELGRCYQEQRKYEKALENLQNAIEIAPGDAQNYYFAGLVYKENKDFENAETMLKRAAKLAPTNLNIHRQLGAVTVINLVQNSQVQTGLGQSPYLAAPVERIGK
jgi:tetratricopeptide (TPR) repeat protein